MINNYNIRYKNHTVELTKAGDTTIVYKIPYEMLVRNRVGFEIQNKFIVYVLEGRDTKGRTVIYVGKSINDIKTRPTSHKDKCDNWINCYVLTQFKERTFLNDATIQFIEDRLNGIVDSLKDKYVNTTNKTNVETTNPSDNVVCEEYLSKSLYMLDVLGLNLIGDEDEENIDIQTSNIRDYSVVPNGIYTLKEQKIKRDGNRIYHAKMEVKDGLFIVKKDSEISELSSLSMASNVDVARRQALIEDGILMEDYSFDNPSACSQFVIGASSNGWTAWLDKNGYPIDDFRKKNGENK